MATGAMLHNLSRKHQRMPHSNQQRSKTPEALEVRSSHQMGAGGKRELTWRAHLQGKIYAPFGWKKYELLPFLPPECSPLHLSLYLSVVTHTCVCNYMCCWVLTTHWEYNIQVIFEGTRINRDTRYPGQLASFWIRILLLLGLKHRLLMGFKDFQGICHSWFWKVDGLNQCWLVIKFLNLSRV